MKKAIDSAAKWLTDKVRSNPKLNPIPYAFFKSIINKQIEWAGKRGVSLDFEELSQAVRAELLKVGIYTMSDSKQDVEIGEAIPPLLIHFNSAGEAASAMIIFDWLHSVLMKAHAGNYSELMLTASRTQEAGNA